MEIKKRATLADCKINAKGEFILMEWARDHTECPSYGI